MNREVTLSIKGNEYKVNFPTAGQFVDIEFLKSTLSKGRYGSLVEQGTMESTFALDVIDTEAYLTVLTPKLIQDLKVNSIRDLSIEDIIELNEVRKDQLLPFINSWRKIIEDSYKKEVEKKKGE